jgi:hypothetical protein
LKVETAFSRLPEQINIFRKSYNATGFRGPQGWEALQSLAGNYRQNPELTIQVLQAAKQDAEQFIKDAQDALAVGVTGATPNVPVVGAARTQGNSGDPLGIY